MYACGNTLAVLAQRRGIPATALEKTVADYNQAAGKSRNTRPAILKPPYHSLGPIKYLMGFTEGGLAVNESLQVLGNDDQPIPGLFAAGGVGQGGLLLLGHGHHIGWAFTSGRIAGRNAAFLATSEDLPEARSGSV